MKHRVAFRLLIYVALVAGLLGTVGSTSAQNSIPVTIPFAFVVNHQSMPAGDYRLRFLTPPLMALADGRTGVSKVLLLVRPVSERNVETRGRLIFVRSRARYFLKEVRIAGSSVHTELVVEPSLAREWTTRTRQPESKVEIALEK